MQTQVFVQLGTILLWLGDLGPHLECSQGGKEGELSVLPELVQKTKPCRRGCKPLQVYSHLYVELEGVWPGYSQNHKLPVSAISHHLQLPARLKRTQKPPVEARQPNPFVQPRQDHDRKFSSSLLPHVETCRLSMVEKTNQLVESPLSKTTYLFPLT